MNGKNLLTGLGIAGGALGIIGGVMSIVQTADEMKNGIKLRNDQLDYIAAKTSIHVTNNILENVDVIADSLSERMAKKLGGK